LLLGSLDTLVSQTFLKTLRDLRAIILQNEDNLQIPPYTLSPPDPAIAATLPNPWQTYQFQIACIVDGQESKSADAVAELRVIRGELTGRLLPPDTLVDNKMAFFLNARLTIDPDVQ
jgi:hypothetical protein